MKTLSRRMVGRSMSYDGWRIRSFSRVWALGVECFAWEEALIAYDHSELQ